MWINTRPWLAAIWPFLPYEAESIGDALGLGQLRGIFVGAGTDGRPGTGVCHMGWKGDTNGLLGAPIARAVSLDTARLCSPEDAGGGLQFVWLRGDG